MTQKKLPLIITPKGVFGYAWLLKPDTAFTNGDDSKAKYKITIKFAKETLGEETSWTVGKERHTGTGQDFLDYIVEQHVKAGGSKRKKCPVKDGDNEFNKKDEPRHPGFMYLEAKTGYKPDQVDAKRAKLKGGVSAFSGDVGKIAFKFFEYDDGLTLRLAAVQLLEKNNDGGSGGFGNAFDEEDGFETSGDAVSESDENDEDDEPDF